MSQSQPDETHLPGSGVPTDPDTASKGANADLRGLLDALVGQLSDADRRHTETVSHMQDRLASIGREAQSLRERVPDEFNASLDRIENGMATLADRFAGASGGASDSAEPPAIAPAGWSQSSSLQAPAGESPVALRSAADALGQAARVRVSDRATAGVDTFDVIESSLPGNTEEPWDGHSAEALTGHYESVIASYAENPLPISAPRAPLAEKASSLQPPQSAPRQYDPASLDRSWMEAKFSEIAARIEQSIAEIRPDDSFFALNQRFDRFEQGISKLAESSATHEDIEGIRQLGAQVSDVAKYLEQAHDQLERLNAIEDQLALVSSRLDDVHRFAIRSEIEAESQLLAFPSAAELDVEGVVKSAIDATAKRFADLQTHQPQSCATELRPLIERLMGESRQGGEQTTALLDTLQQAMIRLLDRVDAIEAGQQRAPTFGVPPSPPPAAGHLAQTPIPPSVTGSTQPLDQDDATKATQSSVAALRAAVSSFSIDSADGDDFTLVELPESPAMPSNEATSFPGPNAKADLVAEAQRARMRLAGETPTSDTRVAPKASKAGGGKAPVSAAPKTSRKPAPSRDKSAAPSAPSARLIFLAAMMLAALAGLWYTSEDGRPPAAHPSATSSPAESSGAATSPATQDGTNGANSLRGLPAKRGDLELKNDTEGETLPGNLRVGDNGASLSGVTIDTDAPISAADFQRAQRRQAMAQMSGRIGSAVAKSTSALVTPAALVADEQAGPQTQNEGRDANSRNTSLAISTPLDMPPATIGPLSLRLAAANGDPSAEFEVGARLAEGKGIAQNFPLAAKWYQRSASRGFAQAQYRLGTLYERGLGVQADAARAETWYNRAAEQGNIKAMHNLAVMSASQAKGSPDYVTAAQWFREAADRGLPDSQFNLAILCENGLGVAKDLRQAFMWISLAARGGDADAARRRDILRGKLSAGDLAKAEAMIAAWRTKPVDNMVNDARFAGAAWKKPQG